MRIRRGKDTQNNIKEALKKKKKGGGKKGKGVLKYAEDPTIKNFMVRKKVRDPPPGFIVF